MKRLRLIAILTIVLMAGLLALYLHRNREPSYQGRTLTQWWKMSSLVHHLIQLKFQ